MRNGERDGGGPGRSTTGGVLDGRTLAWAAPLATFAAASLLAALRLPTLEPGPRSTVVASALALDLTVTAPGLVWVLLVRKRRVPWIALPPAFVLGYVLALVTLPEEQGAVLEALGWLAVPAEGALVAWIVVRARRALAGAPAGAHDFATRFRISARRTLGSRVPADILTTEIAVLYHAFRPLNRSKVPAVDAFTVHREAGYPAVASVVALLVVVETTAVHLLVGLWSTTVAWVLSGLSAYAIVWLLGDGRALGARPTRVTAAELRLRVGLRWEVDVPRSRIAEVRRLSPGEASEGEGLRAVVIGDPNVRLALHEPVEVTGMYGTRRRVRVIRLRVDEADRFCARLGDGGRVPDSDGLYRIE
jgi:hypothetical protein